MTLVSANVFYQVVAVAYAIFAGFLLVRASRTRITWYYAIAQLTTAIWAQIFVLASNGILPVAAVDGTAVLRDAG